MLWHTTIMRQRFSLLSEGVAGTGRPYYLVNDESEAHLGRWRS